MNRCNIGLVLVRLFSVYLAVTALQSLFFYLPAFFRPMMDLSDSILSVGFWFSAGGVLIPAFCAYWMWRNAGLFVPEQPEKDELPITAPQLMYVGISLLGLYFLSWGVVSFVRVESTLVANEPIDPAFGMAQRAPYITQVLIAVPMLLGRRRLTEWLLKIKYFAIDRT